MGTRANKLVGTAQGKRAAELKKQGKTYSQILAVLEVEFEGFTVSKAALSHFFNPEKMSTGERVEKEASEHTEDMNTEEAQKWITERIKGLCRVLFGEINETEWLACIAAYGLEFWRKEKLEKMDSNELTELLEFYDIKNLQGLGSRLFAESEYSPEKVHLAIFVSVPFKNIARIEWIIEQQSKAYFEGLEIRFPTDKIEFVEKYTSKIYEQARMLNQLHHGETKSKIYLR